MIIGFGSILQTPCEELIYGSVCLLDGVIREPLRFHTAIVDAIERGDYRAAKQKMTEHLLGVAERIESQVETNLDLEPLF